MPSRPIFFFLIVCVVLCSCDPPYRNLAPFTTIAGSIAPQKAQYAVQDTIEISVQLPEVLQFRKIGEYGQDFDLYSDQIDSAGIELNIQYFDSIAKRFSPAIPDYVDVIELEGNRGNGDYNKWKFVFTNDYPQTLLLKVVPKQPGIYAVGSLQTFGRNANGFLLFKNVVKGVHGGVLQCKYDIVNPQNEILYPRFPEAHSYTLYNLPFLPLDGGGYLGMIFRVK